MGKKASDSRGTAPSLTTSQAGLYRHLAKSVPFGMAVLDLLDPRDVSTWRLVAINATASRVAGASVAGLLSLKITPQVEGRSPVKLESLCQYVVSRKEPKPAGHLSLATTSSREFYAVSAFPLEGNCAGLLFQNMTLLRETTRELIGTKWQIDQMCESAGSILWRARPLTLEFTHVTRQAEQVLGYWIERWLRESNFWKKRVHRDDWGLVEDSCAKAASGAGKLHFECRMFSLQGDIRWFRVHVQKTELPSGRAELSGVMVDITDQKRAAEASRELSMAIMRAQEQERKTISRELHDSIGQHLTGLNYALGRLRRNRHGSRRMRETVHECIETVQECMNEIRSVSYMLRPPLVDLLGLAPALRSYTDKFSQQSGIRLEVGMPQGTSWLDTDAQVALFRIAQECLTNVQRHSRAKSARIRLTYEPALVLLDVEDHGIGLNPSLMRQLETGAGGPGLGLLKMRERVTDLKGSLEIQSDGTGTAIRVKIPRPVGTQPSKDAIREAVPSHRAAGIQRSPATRRSLGMKPL